MTTQHLISDLEIDEGLRLTSYQDTRGNWTIGYGHTPATVGQTVTSVDAGILLVADISHAMVGLTVFLPWWRKLDDVRQDVIVEMAFNLGVAKLCEFTHTLKCIQSGDWAGAHDAMLASEWASQVGRRAVRLAVQMETGVHQP